MTTVREQHLLNWLHAKEVRAIAAMNAAIEAGDIVEHGRQSAAFDALAAAWEKMNALIAADTGVSE